MKHFSCIMLLVLFPGLMRANNTTSVFSPEVRQGSRAVEYRFSLEDEEGPDSWAHRLHYQQALDDAWRWRLIGAFGDPNDTGHEFRYTRLEMQWQYLESEEAGWDAALRYELQIADGDDRPSRVRVAWTGKWNFDSGLELRANFLTGHQFGPEHSDGFLVETRSQATVPVASNLRLGLELFNDFNNTKAFGSFDDQEHQIGPVFKAKIGSDWSLLGSVQIGLSDGAADRDYRFHLIRSF